MKVLTNNIGIVGSSHGGNACGLAMLLHGSEFPDLAFYASMESPYGEGNVNVMKFMLGGPTDASARMAGEHIQVDPKAGQIRINGNSKPDED